MRSQKFCCELNVRYESMIDDLQDLVKDLKQKQKDAYLLELDLRGKIIDLEKALAEKRSAWAEQGLHLANAQKERDQWKYTAEIRQQHLEYTIKAQAGEQEPVELTWELLETKPKLYLHPTTERRVIPEDEKLRMALENCRLLAARHRKEDWALLILGFCAEGGVVGSVMR